MLYGTCLLIINKSTNTKTLVRQAASTWMLMRNDLEWIWEVHWSMWAGILHIKYNYYAQYGMC